MKKIYIQYILLLFLFNILASHAQNIDNIGIKVSKNNNTCFFISFDIQMNKNDTLEYNVMDWTRTTTVNCGVNSDHPSLIIASNTKKIKEELNGLRQPWFQLKEKAVRKEATTFLKIKNDDNIFEKRKYKIFKKAKKYRMKLFVFLEPLTLEDALGKEIKPIENANFNLSYLLLINNQQKIINIQIPNSYLIDIIKSYSAASN